MEEITRVVIESDDQELLDAFDRWFIPRLVGINRAFGTDNVSPVWLVLADELVAATQGDTP